MNTLWYKIVITLKESSPTIIDLITNELFERQSTGVEVDYAHGYLENHPNLFGEIIDEIPKERLEHDTEIIAYFEEELNLEELIQSLSLWIEPTKYTIEQFEQEAENWQNNWMAYYQPESISRFLTIVPEWYAHDYQARTDERVIILDPGVAFGTGNHPTTQLGAQALEMVIRGGETVLDVGTGSGILAFIARAFGAHKVYGYDLDPQAVDSANKNLILQLNHQNIEFSVNNLLKEVTHEADIIVANILPHILVEMLDDAKRLLKQDGWLILGGILEEKSDELEDALKNKGWYLVQKNQMNGWVCLIAKKLGEN